MWVAFAVHSLRYLRTWAPSGDCNQPADVHSLIRLVVVCIKKLCIRGYQNAPSEDSDQIAQLRSLILVFTGRTCPKVRSIWALGLKICSCNKQTIILGTLNLTDSQTDQIVRCLRMTKRLVITKTYLCYFDPLKPHFYIVKLGFTGVYIIFLISAQKHRLRVPVRTASPRRF